jgi:hypothetical protein
MGSSVDLEARFIKSYSSSTFVAIVNASSHFRNLIAKELKEQLQDVLQEAQSLGAVKASAVIELDSDEFSVALFGGPPDQSLHRSLYRQSKFFSEIKRVVISLNKDGKASVSLHVESAPLQTAQSIEPHTLDPFNQYVFLHALSYVKRQWRAQQKNENYQRVHKVLEEVVMDKIGALREATKEL